MFWSSEGTESGSDVSVKASLRKEEKSAWKLSYSVLLFNLSSSATVFVDDTGVFEEVKSWLVDRNELIKSEWLSATRGLGADELDLLLASDVVVFSENWVVNDDTGLDDDIMWDDGWLKDEAPALGEAGGGVATAAHVITDPDWSLPFVAGVAD